MTSKKFSIVTAFEKYLTGSWYTSGSHKEVISMFNKQIAIVGTISEPGTDQSYIQLLAAAGITPNHLKEEEYLEVSPRRYQVRDSSVPGNVVSDMMVRTGSYQGTSTLLFFVEISINLGKGVTHHSAVIYDTEPSPDDMKKIIDNYQNFILHATTDEVVMDNDGKLLDSFRYL